MGFRYILVRAHSGETFGNPGTIAETVDCWLPGLSIRQLESDGTGHLALSDQDLNEALCALVRRTLRKKVVRENGGESCPVHWTFHEDCKGCVANRYTRQDAAGDKPCVVTEGVSAADVANEPLP